MTRIHIEESRLIDAPPAAVYAVLSDYHVGHPAILPKPYFTGLKVLEGGQGAGTVTEVEMQVMGVKRTHRQEITEPEPGRVLHEKSLERETNILYETTFTVDPSGEGQQSWVTIATDFESSPGLMGLIQRLMNPPTMRQIYRKELQQLNDYLQQGASA